MLVATLLIPLLFCLIVSSTLQIYYALKIVPIFNNEPTFKDESFPVIEWAETISIPHPRGYQLRGSRYRQTSGKSQGLILFLPEFHASHYSAWKYCQGLYAHGYDILSVNFTSQGESDHDSQYRPRFWVGQREREDLELILAEIRSIPEWAAAFVGIYGVSRSAATALAVVSHRPEIPVLIAEGAYANRQIIERAVRSWLNFVLPVPLGRMIPMWHIMKTVDLATLIFQLKNSYWFCHPRRFTRGQTTRVLLLAGSKDKYIPREFTEDLVSRFRIPNAEICIFPGANHNQARVIDPAGYDLRMLSFLNGHAADDADCLPLKVGFESASAA